MKIRLAEESDIPRIVEMSQKFYAITTYPAFAPYDVPTAEQLCRTLIYSGILLVADSSVHGVVGMIGMQVQPFLFNTRKTQATEVIWWVEEEYRGSATAAMLMMEMERQANLLGVDYIVMLSLSSSPPQAAAMYERLGYVNTEYAWSKAIS